MAATDKRTIILDIDPIKPQEDRIAEAAKFIKKGELVVFPTETVYGIGANALDSRACAEIFKVKGRPSDNPLIVHVSSIAMAEKYGAIPEKFHNQILSIWPSPITFIVQSKGNLPKEVTAGLDTVAIRMPAHPVALSLIEKAGCPIAAPSANPSKKPTAASGSNAIRYFDGKVGCIIDSGRTFFGIESTIIDLRSFSILRPGPFSPEEVEKAFGMKPKIGRAAHGKSSVRIAVSPGTKYQHYSPDTPIIMFSGNDPEELADILDEFEDLPPLAFIGSEETCNAVAARLGCSTIPLGPIGNKYEIAKNLYDALILLDSLKVKFAVVESFEETGIGLAIMNRLRKACSGWEFSNMVEFRKVGKTFMQ
jgi:L-threonylcarbamoyladenylate synthase